MAVHHVAVMEENVEDSLPNGISNLIREKSISGVPAGIALSELQLSGLIYAD
jgi:hypothetical protein